MKIGIIGATGKQGQATLKEALSRNLDVTAIIRNKHKLSEDVPFLEKDLFKLTTTDLTDFDIIVDAFNAPIGQEKLHQTSLKHLTTILANTNVKLIVVGGASSLFIDAKKTTLLGDTPDFPEAAKPTAENMRIALTDLRNVTNFDWVYLSPAAFFNANGKKTSHYQLAGDILISNSQGKSEISYADYAVALVDEIESNSHHQERISVVSQ
ncbi:NAD(P)-dependent oxidoreductase [Dellaglioa sp. L3N]